MIYVGIDPGLTGAVCIIDGRTGKIDMYDMPIVKVRKKNRYDSDGLYSIFTSLPNKRLSVNVARHICVFFEKTQAMPKGFKSQASWGLGYCEGSISMLLRALGIPYELIRAKEWQKFFGISKVSKTTKGQSYLVASRLFPHISSKLKTERGKVLDGRCDALLIAEYGRRQRMKGVDKK